MPSADLEHVKISTRCAFTCGGCAPPGNASGVAVGGDDGASARERARRAARDAGLAPCADGEPCLDAYGVARGVEHPRSLMVAATSMLKPASATPKNVAHGRRRRRARSRRSTTRAAKPRRRRRRGAGTVGAGAVDLHGVPQALRRQAPEELRVREAPALPARALPRLQSREPRGLCQVGAAGARAAGLCEARGTEEWHIQWGRVWQHPKAPFLNASIPEGAIVNSVPGCSPPSARRRHCRGCRSTASSTSGSTRSRRCPQTSRTAASPCVASTCSARAIV